MNWVRTSTGLAVNMDNVTHVTFTHGADSITTARLFFIGQPLDKNASLMLVEEDARRLADWLA